MALLFGLLNKLRGTNASSGVPSWMRLLAAIIVYVCYVLVGAAIVQAIEEGDEFDATAANAKWNFGSACYFFVVTTTTIGYGDISPATSGGRAFVAIYGLVGLGLVGYVISMAGGAVMDFMGWQRKMFVKHILRQGGSGKADPNVSVPWYVAHSALLTACVTWILFLFVGAAIFRETERLDDAEALAAGVTTSTEWSYRNALWFCWVTLTTIGYGDFFPTTNAGKVLLPLYAVFSLGVVGVVIGEIGETVARSAEKALLGKGAVSRLTADKAADVAKSAKAAAGSEMDDEARRVLQDGLRDALRRIEAGPSTVNYRSAGGAGEESYSDYTDDYSAASSTGYSYEDEEETY